MKSIGETTNINDKRKIYFENLDGLRFLCFLSVFFFHSFYTNNNEIQQTWIYSIIKKDIFGNGNLGVNFFFILSGFLITYLLLEEKKINGQINLKNFWIRRILRIWPLFYFCVFFGFIIFPQLKQLFGQNPNETANYPYYLVFLNNFDFIKNGLPDSSVLGVLWSVAIEEQFYLIWPIIVYLFPIKKLWIPFSTIILFSLTFRFFNDTPIIHEHHTFSCIGDMTMGAICAYLIINNQRFKNFIENINRFIIYLVYVSFITIFLFRDELLFSHHIIRIFERLIISLPICFIILEQSFSKNSFFKMSQFRTISKLGNITYGLYCLHFIGILITLNITRILSFNSQIWQVMIIETILSLILTIIISTISYKYFESPFLKLKERFAFFQKK